MSELAYRRWGLWPRVFVILIGSGALASLIAVLTGTPSSRDHSAALFGLCAGLNVLCGRAVETGALVVLAIAHLLRLPGSKQVRRASLVLAASGFAVMMLGILSGFPLSHPPWPAVFQLWRSSSVLHGALWSLVLLCLLGAIEFLPEQRPRVAGTQWFSMARQLEMSLVILAVISATVQQTALSREFSARDAMSPLWSGPRVGMLFFLSSICGALALLIFALRRATIAPQRSPPISLIRHLAPILNVATFTYLAVRVSELLDRGLATVMFARSKESELFLLEIAAFVLGIVWLAAGDSNQHTIQAGAVMIVCGTMLNRLNTSITAMERTAGPYRPHWIEVLITMSVVAVGIATFGFCAKHLSVFVEQPEGPRLGGQS